MFDLNQSERNILVIESGRAITASFETLLDDSYRYSTAPTVKSAYGFLERRDFGVIVIDQALCGSDFREIALIKRRAPHSSFVVAGDRPSFEAAVAAMRAGAHDFLWRPFEAETLETSLAAAVDGFETRYLKDQYQVHLEHLAAERATEIDKVLEEVESSYRVTLKALVQALETRDFETHGHSERVVTFSLRLGCELGLEKDDLRDLELGALLHDIGKIGVPDAILRKPSKLNADEWEKMKLHPVHGRKILRNIGFLRGAARVVAQHHERWDGGGYPYGLRGEEIDLGARIFAVVDAFDAMVSDRVYRRGRSYEAAVEELERCAGTQFDPMIVEAFKLVPREDWEVLRERSLMEKSEIASFMSIVSDLVYSREIVGMVH